MEAASMKRVLPWLFDERTQPDVLVALMVVDVAWNVVVPKDKLAAHDEQIGIQPWLRPWLLPIKMLATIGLIMGRRWPRFGAFTAALTAVYFVFATGYHVRAKDSVVGTAPAVVYLGLSARTARSFMRHRRTVV